MYKKLGFLLKKNILLFLTLLLLQGCSFSNLLLENEVNQVTVVNYTSFKKHHRAYFTRDTLKPILNGKKYLYLYKRKSNELAILLHRKNKYLLYSMTIPNQKPYTMKVTNKTTLSQVLNGFKKYGYVRIKSLANKGYISTVSYKKYKGFKTLLVETKKYSHLQNIYRKAIKSYDSSKIRHIKTKLPTQLIHNYYQFYKKRATSNEQRIQLRIIATKIGLTPPSIIIRKTTSTKKSKKPYLKSSSNTDKLEKNHIKKVAIEEFVIEEDDVEIKPTPTPIPTPIIKNIKPKAILKKSTKPFSYYLNQASLPELSLYIANSRTKKNLSYSKYSQLTHKRDILKEEKVLTHGSLEELIAAYKINKKAKFKQRIMTLMKDKQTE